MTNAARIDGCEPCACLRAAFNNILADRRLWLARSSPQSISFSVWFMAGAGRGEQEKPALARAGGLGAGRGEAAASGASCLLLPATSARREDMWEDSPRLSSTTCPFTYHPCHALPVSFSLYPLHATYLCSLTSPFCFCLFHHALPVYTAYLLTLCHSYLPLPLLPTACHTYNPFSIGGCRRG